MYVFVRFFSGVAQHKTRIMFIVLYRLYPTVKPKEFMKCWYVYELLGFKCFSTHLRGPALFLWYFQECCASLVMISDPFDRDKRGGRAWPHITVYMWGQRCGSLAGTPAIRRAARCPAVSSRLVFVFPLWKIYFHKEIVVPCLGIVMHGDFILINF